MPTIIDELVTVLKLDATDFARNKRQVESDLDALKRASRTTAQEMQAQGHDLSAQFGKDWQDKTAKVEENLKRVGQESRRTAVNMKTSGKEAAEFFTTIKAEALGLIGVLVGATGLTAMLRSSAEAARSLKQEATAIDIDPQRLSAMSLALERRGGSAAGVRGSLMGLSQQRANALLGHGDQNFLNWMPIIGANLKDDPATILEKFIEYAQKNKQNGPRVYQAGAGLHIDQGTIAAALSFGSVGEYRQAYTDELKNAPTKQEIEHLDALNTKFIELEHTLLKLGTDISEDWSKPMGEAVDVTKDFIRAHESLVKGITEITSAMVALKALGGISGVLGLDGLAVAARTLGGLLGDVMKFAPWLLLTGPAGGEDPAFSKQKNDEYLRTHPESSPWGWLRQHLPPWLGGTGTKLPGDIEAEVRKQAAAHGLDQDHMVRLATKEGGGYDRISPAGAFGPMQLMPATAASVGVTPGSSWQENIRGGMDYYKLLLRKFNGNYAAADAAYNAGPDNPGVKHFFATGDTSQLPAETRDYVNSINGAAKPSASSSAALPPGPYPQPGFMGNMNPLLFQSSYQVPAATDNSKSVTIGISNINVQTNATDAKGVAKGLSQALVAQANRGLA